MKRVELKNETQVVIPKASIARGFFERFRGLMLKRSIPGDEAVIFPKCNSIHTFFMLFSIDVVMVNDKGEVVEVMPALAPWRMTLPRRKVKHVIEMKPGRAAELGIGVGTKLSCEGVWA